MELSTLVELLRCEQDRIIKRRRREINAVSHLVDGAQITVDRLQSFD